MAQSASTSVLNGPPRVVGVDVGTKRVGVAVSDPLRLFAKPHGTFSPDEALAALQSLDADNGVDVVVVGWPLTEEGKTGEAVEMVADYVERIESALGSVQITRRDERFTSEIAKDLLREAGVKQPGRYDKGRVDAAAAAVILQDYLNVQNRS
ncbi:MAG: Holliday junction resolvase RuvX [Bacteroidetes bacterium QH_7_62_13]|nr:MAG: Holliday junction resolvase RuvX [Bacteroidetes bacterium QH_7_62_13]